MKYVFCDCSDGSMFNEEFDNQEDAIRYGEKAYTYLSLSKHDLSRCEGMYVLESANPDEEAEDHFDGNLIKRWV